MQFRIKYLNHNLADMRNGQCCMSGEQSKSSLSELTADLNRWGETDYAPYDRVEARVITRIYARGCQPQLPTSSPLRTDETYVEPLWSPAMYPALTIGFFAIGSDTQIRSEQHTVTFRTHAERMKFVGYVVNECDGVLQFNDKPHNVFELLLVDATIVKDQGFLFRRSRKTTCDPHEQAFSKSLAPCLQEAARLVIWPRI